MPDPSVSPADTIRQALECVSHTQDFYRVHHPERCPRCLGHAALDVLLAVGKRDKAEIERLRERLDQCKRWHDG